MNKDILHSDFEYGQFKWINYVNLSYVQKCEVLHVRNLWDVRRWMASTDTIPLDTHIAFIDKLASSLSSAYWAIYKDDAFIGGCSIVDVNKGEATSGIFMNPKYIGSGLGCVVSVYNHMMFFEYLGMDCITGFEKKTNKPVVRLNKFVGYQITQEDDEYYYVSMKKETWVEKKDLLLKMTQSFSYE